jgi:hypothetical protein
MFNPILPVIPCGTKADDLQVCLKLSQAVGEIKFRNAAQGQTGNNKLRDTSIGAVAEIPWN